MTEADVPKLPEGYELISDPGRIDATAAHEYLSRSYWASGITIETVEKSLAHSLCIAIRFDNRQVAMARLITDRATFAYLADVYVLEHHRGKGLSKIMVHHLRNLPELSGLRFWALLTRDAQGLYEQFGWKPYPHPDRFMAIDFSDY